MPRLFVHIEGVYHIYLPFKGKMAIQFDNGGKWLVEQRGSGWIKDCTEGKSWRMKKLDGLTSLDVKKERDKKWGRRERFVKTVDQNSLQK